MPHDDPHDPVTCPDCDVQSMSGRGIISTALSEFEWFFESNNDEVIRGKVMLALSSVRDFVKKRLDARKRKEVEMVAALVVLNAFILHIETYVEEGKGV